RRATNELKETFEQDETVKGFKEEFHQAQREVFSRRTLSKFLEPDLSPSASKPRKTEATAANTAPAEDGEQPAVAASDAAAVDAQTKEDKAVEQETAPKPLKPSSQE